MIKIIQDAFTGLTPILWVSQACGIVGFLLFLVSTQLPKNSYLLCAAISYLFFTAESLLAGLFVNSFLCIVSFVRNVITVYFLTKKNSELPKVFIYAILVTVWVGEIIIISVQHGWNQPINFLPTVMVTFLTVIQNSPNKYVVKLGVLIHESGYLCYFIYFSLPFSILRQSFFVLSCILYFIRNFIADKKAKSPNA